MPTYRTFSSAETIDLGRKLAVRILAHARFAPISKSRAASRARAVVIALRGELGSGKTTFVKGLYKGFGSRTAVTSPTFIIMRRTGIRKGGFRNLFHIDAYRLREAEIANNLGIREIMAESRNVVIIEWPERMPRLIPRRAIRAIFRHGAHLHERRITL